MFTRYVLAVALALATCPTQAQYQALRTTIAQLASAAPANMWVALCMLETNDTLSYSTPC